MKTGKLIKRRKKKKEPKLKRPKKQKSLQEILDISIQTPII
jgi:hypothetical protein